MDDESRKRRIKELNDLIENEEDARISDDKQHQNGEMTQATLDNRERTRIDRIRRWEQEIQELESNLPNFNGGSQHFGSFDLSPRWHKKWLFALLIALVLIAAAYLLLKGEVLRFLAKAKGNAIVVSVNNKTLSIEAFEVTVERYRMCVEANVCNEHLPLETRDGIRNPYYNSGQDQYPAVGIDAKGAFTFCNWISRRLPTVDEWWFVAHGGDKNTDYPWGLEPPDPTRANLDYKPHETSSSLEKVGDRPKGNFKGIEDLIGNASEWTRSIAESGDYNNDTRIWDSSDEAPIALYTVGGSYSVTPEGLKQPKTLVAPTNSTRPRLEIGFRCVE